MVLPPPPLHHPSNGMDVYESEQQNNDMRFFGTPLTLPTRNTIKDTEFIAAVAGANTVQLRQRRTSNATPSTAFGVSTKTSQASESKNKSVSNQPSPLRGEDVTTNASSYSQKLSIDKSNRDPSPIMIPPHVTRSLEKSRGTSSNDSITSTRSASVIDASFTSDSYSLLSSMQFISRDLEEEERANKSKSDRERAFLYKKRYMDVYGLAIGLTRRVTELEKGRLKRLEEIRLLKQALERNDGGSEDEKLQTLCRQVNQLARELSEPEEIVRSSREEEEIKSLRARVERLESEKEQAWNEVKRLNENKVLMEKERQELQASLHRTEQELEAVHTLWLKEKSDWNETVDQYKKQMSCDAETWKREVGRWKEHEMDMRQQLEQANRCIGVLQTQVDNRTEIDRMHQELVEAAVENQTMRQELSTRTQALDKAKERLITLEQAVYQVEGVRRRLHNQVMELKGNIRVFCRVRPMLSHEQKMDTSSTEIFQYPDYHCDRRQIELLAHPKSHVGYGSTNLKKYAFDFDLVFNGYCTQTHIFDEVSTLIQSALDGFNVSIFAYGQTGSGKTYTMMHGMIREEENEMGIVGRALELLFNRIEELDASGWSFTVSLEMIEIYNESLRDLLASTESMDKVDLRLDSQGKPTVINACSHVIQNPGEAYTSLEKALTRRATKSTQMNDRSSRSHCVISIRLVGVNELMKEERKSVVHLIDLAGSERLSKSGSGQDKEKLKEAQCINKSLSALGNVIAAIGKKSSHVPFRDSKLTHFLRPSLGGDAKTLMICTLSPLSQHREETLNSLRFAKTVNSCEITYPSYYEQSTKSS